MADGAPDIRCWACWRRSPNSVGVMGRTREPSGFSAENEVGKDTDGTWPRVGLPSARALKDAAAVLARNWRRDDLGWSEAVYMRMAEKLYLGSPGAVKRALTDWRSKCRRGQGKSQHWQRCDYCPSTELV